MVQGQSEFSAAERDEIGRICAELVLGAGAKIMKARCAGPIVRYKSDASPVCNADEQAETEILAGLASHFPDIPVISEEAFAASHRMTERQMFFLVDPLDGTKEFVAGDNGFTVNIALLDKGRPIAGAVYAPALGRAWFAGAHAYAVDLVPGQKLPPESDWRKISVRSAPKSGLTALSSRSHGESRSEALLAHLPVTTHQVCGSSLKFCSIAEGTGDIYPRFSPTMEWDTAAGDAILRAAGGCVLTETGEDLTYGRTRDSYKNPGFVALGDISLRKRVIALIAELG